MNSKRFGSRSLPLATAITVLLGFHAQAGDLLRGGAPAGAAGARARVGNRPPELSGARNNARDALSQTAQALQAVQDMQKAARVTARRGNGIMPLPGIALPPVPNGVGTGGLQVAPGVPADLLHPGQGENPDLWQGAQLPTQTTSDGHYNVTIEQTQPQALLTWETFNIGEDTTLFFDQRAGGADKTKWIAFNLVDDPSGIPSQILGSIRAPGQVYVINQNGIIFGGSSQINLHGLVASSLPINTNLLERGLLNNPDFQFLFSALPIYVLPGGGTMPAFDPPEPNTPDGRIGDVIVQEGAQLNATTSAAGVGGRIALVGANVENAGTISTPDGQTILAAGLQVGFTAHPGSDPSLRGLDVHIGQVVDPNSPLAPYAGTATNSGLIDAPRASVTIAGKRVEQFGFIESSTSATLNGRVDLLANYNTVTSVVLGEPGFYATATGGVTLGEGSVTRILPELFSDETVTGLELPLTSQVNIQGKAIHLDRGAQIFAPNADVTLQAGTWKPANGAFKFVLDQGQVYLDEGASINVSGSIDVLADIAQNIIAAELRGAELADSPLIRLGILRGQTVFIDIRRTGSYLGLPWVGTPLADVSGYAGLIARSVGELTAAGGTVKIKAGESVVMQPGSVIDVSGGWINYEGGMVQTSRLLANGVLYDIANATPDRIYDAVYTGQFYDVFMKYGLLETYNHPLALTGAHYENGYTWGANGGSIDISAPSMALDGALRGQTITGERQRELGPTPSALALVFQAQDGTNPSYPFISPTPPSIVFSDTLTQPRVGEFVLDAEGNPLALPEERRNLVVLSPDLFTTGGFGTLTVDNSDGDISVPAGVTLSAPERGSITLSAANLDIQGSIIAPAGTLNFNVFEFSPYQFQILSTTPGSVTPPEDPNRGNFTLGANAVLSTAGYIVDDRPGAPGELMLPIAVDGGSISIRSHDVNLVAGSLIDVSGGVIADYDGTLSYGVGGSISIAAGQDINISSLLGGSLTLDATLRGYSGARGGELAITAPLIQIGGTTDHPDTLLLSPEFFNQGGFASFALKGLGAGTEVSGETIPGVLIAPGTVIDPVVRTFVALSDPRDGNAITLQPMVLPVGVRAPVHLSFNAIGVRDTFSGAVLVRGDLVLGEGAVIHTDPLGAVSLAGNTANILGSVFTPGGSITISGAHNSALLFPNVPESLTQPLTTVYIGPDSVLSAAGATVLIPNAEGLRSGFVLPGGTISVDGNIAAAAGALLDVSGTTGVLDLPASYAGIIDPIFGFQSGFLFGSLNGAQYLPTSVASSGGSIILAGAQQLVSNATLRGAAGGPGALGGSLTVSSGIFRPPESIEPVTPLDITLVVSQNGPQIGSAGIGQAVIDAAGNVLGGLGYFGVSDFTGSGFDALTLGGTVQFSGDVTINANRALIVADGGVIFADGNVNLSAGYVALGTPFQPPVAPEDVLPPFVIDGQPFVIDPTFGTGRLTVRGSLIDVGNLVTQGIGSLRLIADHGDIRGDGTLSVAGEIYLRAGQVYPATGVSFTISAHDYTADGVAQSGSVTIVGSGTRPLPLSAGGTLNIYASIIEQRGVLRAPIGTINLGWDGTGDAPVDPITGEPVAITQQLTLGKGSITSVSAIDPITGLPMLIPFGTNPDGSSWFDPAGTDITAGGVPQKRINLAGVNIDDQGGSVVDIRGGGDLYAYQWIEGEGGSRDILDATTSYAVIPGYGAGYAPYDPIFGGGQFGVGDRIYLSGGNGLPAGYYTLLPARYALLPGAFLVTPQEGAPVGNVTLADGASIVSGYRFKNLAGLPGAAPLSGRFEVAAAAVVRSRAQYADYSANNFLLLGALANDAAVPRLPGDSGQLVLQATETLELQGSVLSQSIAGGRGGLVDISSSVDIVVGGSDTVTLPGTLVLDAAQLSRFGAESLLIGGIRSTGVGGTIVTVTTDHLTVDNAGSTLRGPEIILVANDNLTLADGASIEQRGRVSGRADTLLIGNPDEAGSGDGLLVRVTSDATAQVIRSGVTATAGPQLTVGAGVNLSGTSLTLDSTFGTTLDATAALNARAITLGSGQISLVLDNATSPPSGSGLVLTGGALEALQSANTLSLLSYTSIDIYGSGTVGTGGFRNLALRTGEIRGFDNGGGTVTFEARTITLDNLANTTGPGAEASSGGTLVFNADTIRLGRHETRIDQFASVELNAASALRFQNTGALTVENNLAIATPLFTGAGGAEQTTTAGGALTLSAPDGDAPTTTAGGLGASLTLVGDTIVQNSNIVLPSGEVTLHATTGDVTVGGRVDVSGTRQEFFDLVGYTGGGHVDLVSDHGSVNIATGGVVTVAAHENGGNAGLLSVTAGEGTFNVEGDVVGTGGDGGRNGSFTLDVGTIPGGDLADLDAILNEGDFAALRNYRIRTGDIVVGGLANAHHYFVSTDQGSITVTGTIDASGRTGGSISLVAAGSVILADGSVLTVAADEFNSAGKGGSVSLEAGAERNGTYNTTAVVDIQTGSTIDLRVAAQTANSADFGQFGGTLHLRAPQTSDGTDVQINAVNGAILGASSITVEGYRLYDLTGTNGTITTAVQDAIFANGTLFGSHTDTITARLLANNAALANAFVVQVGAEVINRNGDLTLGSANSDYSRDWNLANFRFGPKNAAGVLTLRASGNLVFFNSLTDGFTSGLYNSLLLGHNDLLPANAQSWSYRLAAGADFNGVDFHRVKSLADLGPNSGSLLLGKNAGNASANQPGPNAQTSVVIGNRYQVIRTGSGDIDIATGRNVQLLNQFATIYTAGTQVADPTMGGTFDLPILDANGGQISLGAVQQNPGYPAQYTMAGGNVTINAGGNIEHLTRNTAGQLVADSERQLPMNWLYRRGYVDPLTGEFGIGRFGDIASTTWWIDFSNFFEGVGALGGGNVTMIAGGDISNVDAVIPTNARMAKGRPDAGRLLELGGGDLTIRAGDDIDAGVYYVERGKGTLIAGDSIHTNATRSPSLTNLRVPNEILAPETWLPTTLFLGKGSFDVSAGGDLLLGPVANPFLLPGGYNNTFWYKTYFSTYEPTNSVDVASLSGDVTLRTAATLPAGSASAATPLLLAWLQRELLLTSSPQSASFYQPWLRLNESSVTPFATAAALMPATLRVMAFSENLNLVGDLTLAPSPTGTLDLAAAGSINGLQPNGTALINGLTTQTWGTSTINVSDADPSALPGVASPFAYQTIAGTTVGLARVTGTDFLRFFDALFAESGSTAGPQAVLQTKQALHAPGLLHKDDEEPVHLYAEKGNISGVTLFSPKAARVTAGRDITDIALYLQNIDDADVSVVSAGRDIVAFNENSPLRIAAHAFGNVVNFDSGTLAGDIQISGPGTLEVLAGRNLDLGIGANRGDGTGVGLVSIGNARNPSLPFAGADVIVGAGVGGSNGLDASKLDFAKFIIQFVIDGSAETAARLSELGTSTRAFAQMSEDEQRHLALEMFYLVLRDAGRSASLAADPATGAATGGYEMGFAAIDALFPGDAWRGDIALTSRAIKTVNGGDISIFAPGGGVTVGLNVTDNQPIDQGILTEAGGNISIFAQNDVSLGTSRIFTLRGGDIVIWSSEGDIAAGSAAKTVQAAPPTRVLIDPQSGDVQTDLAGLATGGGIGVLATVAGVEPGDVDLIAPGGTIDAGDAGIRSSGNLNVAAVQVLNADNIAVSGTSAGTPTTTVAAPNLSGLTAASSATQAATGAANEAAQRPPAEPSAPPEAAPSIVTVEVLGYGGGESRDEEEDERERAGQ